MSTDRSHSPPRVLVGALVTALLLVSSAAPGAPKNGQKFDDWQAACRPTANGGGERCYIFQEVSLLIMKRVPKLMMRVAIGYNQKTKKPAMEVTLPLDMWGGVVVARGLSLRIDDGDPQRVPFLRCLQSACIGTLEIDDALLKSLERGKKAQIGFFDAIGREIRMPVSLKGFTAAFASLPK